MTYLRALKKKKNENHVLIILTVCEARSTPGHKEWMCCKLCLWDLCPELNNSVYKECHSIFTMPQVFSRLGWDLCILIQCLTWYSMLQTLIRKVKACIKKSLNMSLNLLTLSSSRSYFIKQHLNLASDFYFNNTDITNILKAFQTFVDEIQFNGLLWALPWTVLQISSSVKS